jgi:D-3-phosphoglycerate dehydrogenase
LSLAKCSLGLAVVEGDKIGPVTRDHRALVTAPFRGEGLATLESLAEVVLDPWIDHRPIRLYNADQLAERVAAEGADLLVVESDFVSGPVFDLPLVAIGSCRGDPNNVDVAGATAHGIPVLRAPGRNADAVAELAVALLFAANRRVVPADRDVREGETFRDGTIPYQRFRAWQLAGKTAGIVGLGAVGRAVRWRFEGLGMRVIAHDPYTEDATHSLDDLLAEADVVTMHAMVTPETKGMIGAEQFARMRDGSVYLNTARAALHDTDALVDALRNGPVGAAGLDHFEGERLATDHPLCALDNVVLTPHIGGATYDTEANHSRAIANGLATLLAGGKPDNLVNPEVLR